MANPILKSDLIEDGLQQELDKLLATMEKLVGGLNNLRGATVQQAQATMQDLSTMQDSAEAYAKASAQIAAMEKALIEERKVTEQLTADIKKLKEEKVKYGKATEDEKANVKSLYEEYKALAGEMRNGSTVTKDRIREIDMEKKSYNELYATYNAVKSVLNGMTTAERENTDAGKAMVAQALQIRDKLNELQKATGNYTLQVGKYRAAFDGLGYSFQQILREAPSALNINQFFLAISNNIPLFLDQLKAFKAEQAEIKANLEQMTKGTKEYAEQLAKVQTVGQKLATTLLSWQSLVLVGLLIIRNWEKIVALVQKLFNKVEEGISSLRRMRQMLNDINANVSKSLEETRTELSLIITNLDGINRGSVEWKNSVERINEIIGSTFDYTKALPAEIKKATKEYLNQQEQIAKNREVVELLAKDSLKRIALDNINNANFSPETITSLLGLSGEDAEDLQKLLTKQRQNQDKLDDLVSRMNNRLGKVGDIRDVAGWTQGQIRLAARGNDEAIDWINSIVKEYHEAYWKIVDDRNWFEKHGGFGLSTLAEIEKMRRNVKLLTKDERTALENLYNPLATRNDNGGGGSTPTEQEMNNQFWKAAEARRNIMLVGYQKELADEKAAHLQQMQEQARANEEMQKAVEENVKNEKITKEEGARRIQELQKQNDDIMEGLILEHHKRVDAINTKYAEMDRQVVVEEELGWIEELDEAYKVDENNRRRRIKTIKDEEQSNMRITESILKMREEIEKLQEKNLTQPEAIEQRTKRIQELEKAIAKLQTQIDHTKQLSNYSSVGDIFRRNVSVGAGTQQSLMESILGKDAYSAFAPGSKELQDAIEKDFDTWMQSAEKSLSTWYSTTMGYINDLIGAYVELANAKAEAAAEATEAAQEEYDKEKALLEAGYASRVEATWAEYQEKKAAQEKAEADAKAAQKAQQELNEAEAMGSLIVASANIWKTFSKIPTVGVPLALAALATMWGSFLQSKIKAAEVSKYGEGGFEVLEGGSHASGHDIDLGVNNRKGRRMRAEGKEGLGIFSRRAMEHYGANNIEAMVNSVNRLEFEGNAAKRMSLERSVGMQILSVPRTDLHRLESGMDKLVSYGARSIHHNPDGTVVETRKNARITYHTMK